MQTVINSVGHRPDTDTVTIPRAEYDALRHAQSFRDTLLEWHTRMMSSGSSQAISAAENWARIASAPSFAELQRRRGDTAARTDGPNPLDAVQPRPRPLSHDEQRIASMLLDAQFGVLEVSA